MFRCARIVPLFWNVPAPLIVELLNWQRAFQAGARDIQGRAGRKGDGAVGAVNHSVLERGAICAVSVPPFPCRVLLSTCAPSRTSVELLNKVMNECATSPETLPCKTSGDVAATVWILPPVLSMFVEIVPLPKMYPRFSIVPFR